jgi:hypothetical protein
LLAAKPGMSQTAIARIWRAFSLAPDRTDAFKLSTDVHFIDKVHDIVGLYLHPMSGLVLCVDEKPSTVFQRLCTFFFESLLPLYDQRVPVWRPQSGECGMVIGKRS